MKRWRRSVCRLVAGEVASVDLVGGAGAEEVLVVDPAAVVPAAVVPVVRVGLLVVPAVPVAG
jgi:hypothetical protein